MLSQRIPTLNQLDGLASLLGLPGTVTGMINDFRQVAEGLDVPEVTHNGEQSAFRHIVKLVETVKCADVVHLIIETELGS